MRSLKTVTSTFIMLFVAALCALLFYVFLTVNYLPAWLNYTMMVLCVVAMIADIGLYVTYLRALDIEYATKEKAAAEKKI